MITLFQFQEKAAAEIADRFLDYLEDPPQAGTKKNPHTVPFFQALSALTGAGKTLILAEAVSQVAATMPVAPVVIWLSRGKVVVRQAFANLSSGGKYHELLDNTRVITLADFDPIEAMDSSSPLLCFATVGTFNQKDKEQGSLTIFQSDIDTTETSQWEALKQRVNVDGLRRPLVVVYDEAHNLSDQQTELLLELEPDGFLLASATMRLPARLAREYEALKLAGWDEDRLVTRVDTTAVVASGLIKNTIDLAGYNAPMEETISKLLEEMKQATADAEGLPQPFQPKAIYVCNTNMVADNAFLADNPKQVFDQRQAPPILIWRYLVDHCDVDPATIAVYADLKTHKDYPLPDEFRLYRGGDSDYEQFTAADYKHIIFNLSLQEGWDDPGVYFAYVDKSMDSRVQVTQVIGRVLRQPNATRYSSDRLNTAHFYVRVDHNETFNGVVKEVERQLGVGGAGIHVVATAPGKAKPVEYLPKMVLEVPETGLDGGQAQGPVQELVAGFADYRAESVNTIGQGSRRVSRQKIGEAGEDSKWEIFEQASRVSARWVFHREVQRRYRAALNVVNLAEPKLNAIIGVGSPAYLQVRDLAEKVVNQYVDDVRLRQRGPNPYHPGPILGRPDEVVTFVNAVHDGYAGLNISLELKFAEALDSTGVPWCRNPPRSGYGIPLVAVGETDKFYPDFLIWTSNRVICIDTKGGHLVREAAGRKLLHIKAKPGAERSLDVQFVSEGKWNNELFKESPDGYTQWGLNDEGKLKAKHFDGLDKLLTTLTTETQEN
jgi:type III restriction enzyme